MAFNGYLIAEAYATLAIDDRKFNAGLMNSGRSWARFTAAMNGGATAGFGPANTQLLKFTRNIRGAKGPIDDLTRSMNKLTAAAKAANTALGGRSMTAYLGGIKAWGTAVGTITKGVGQAFSSMFRGIGAGMGSILGGFGKGIGNTGGLFKGIGQGLESVLRSFGPKFHLTVTSPFRAIRGIASTALAPFRMLRSIISTATAPLRAAFSLKNIAVGVAGATVAGFGAKEFIENSANMELSFARVRRAAEFTDDQFKAFRKDLLDFGNVTNGVKLESLFEIANVGGKIGIAGDQLNLFTRDMAKVRIAISEQDVGTEELAERIGSLISVFHRGNDEAIKFASALNALDLKSTASARDILDVSGRMSGTASLLGMKPHEVLALSTALRQARVPIETAGTAMQQIMGRMASRKDSPQFARIAGMKEKDFLKTVGSDPLKAIIKIEEGLRRLDKITAIRALDQLGLDGQRVRGTLLQLGTVLPQLNDYVKISQNEWKTFGSITESVALIGETLYGRWEKVKTNFATLADTVGQGLLPVLKELSDAVSRLMADLRNSFERNKATLEPWFRWMTEHVQMLGVVWRAWPSFVDYATAAIGEKLDQAHHVFTRFAALVSATMQELGRDIGDYMMDMADNVAIAMNNMNPLRLRKMEAQPLVFGQGRLPIAHRAGDAAARALGDQDRPGAGFNVFGGAMPNRNVAKAKARGEIHDAVQDQKLNDWQARQEMRIKDEGVREQAEMMRRPLEAPGRKRRGADLSLLRPGAKGVDAAANAKRDQILRQNAAMPAAAMPRGRIVGPPGGFGEAGPDRRVEQRMVGRAWGAMEVEKRRARLGVPLAFRDTHADPARAGFMGPLPAEVNAVSAVQAARRGEIGTGARGPRIGRAAQAANAQFREWRRAENLRLRGKRDLRDAGDGMVPGPGVNVKDKEKGVEEVLAETVKQTTELREIKTAMNEIKARPAATI